MLILAPAVALGDRDAAQLERRVGVPAQRLGVGERRSSGRGARGRSDEDRHHPCGILRRQPRPKLIGRVLAHRAIHDHRRWPGVEVIGEVVGGIQRRHERERALGRVALRLVGDVVEDQAVQAERAQTRGGHVGDLPHLPGFRRQTRWGEGEEQKLAVTGLDAADEIHGRDRTGGGQGLRPCPFACRRRSNRGSSDPVRPAPTRSTTSRPLRRLPDLRARARWQRRGTSTRRAASVSNRRFSDRRARATERYSALSPDCSFRLIGTAAGAARPRPMRHSPSAVASASKQQHVHACLVFAVADTAACQSGRQG